MYTNTETTLYENNEGVKRPGKIRMDELRVKVGVKESFKKKLMRSK